MTLVTFGEALLRLTPPHFQRLEQAQTFDAHIGGAELNVAVAASRLGLAARWVSRLPDNALGRTVANRAREHNVDVSRVVWSNDASERLGLYFMEMGAAPRPSTILYDRSASAFRRLTIGAIDWSEALHGATWFHASGITAALGEAPLAVLKEAMAAAHAAQITVSYDLNFRGTLWSARQAREAQEPLMEYVDVLVTSEESARTVFAVQDENSSAGQESASHAARQLQDRFGTSAIAMPVRSSPRNRVTSVSGVVVTRGDMRCSPSHEVEIVDPIGSGDAFVAGIIYGRLRQDSWDAGVRYGAAMAALKLTVPGDFSRATLVEVEECMNGTGRAVRR